MADEETGWKPSVSCVHCGERTRFDMPDDPPPSGLQHLIECEKCGQTTFVPNEVFHPTPTGDEANVEVEE